jgi:hypothetical protein
MQDPCAEHSGSKHGTPLQLTSNELADLRIRDDLFRS